MPLFPKAKAGFQAVTDMPRNVQIAMVMGAALLVISVITLAVVVAKSGVK